MLSDFLIRLRTLFRRKTVENELRDPANKRNHARLARAAVCLGGGKWRG